MRPAPDLRLLLPAVAAWAGVLVGFELPWWLWSATALPAAAVAVRRRSIVLAAVLVAGVACASGAALRSAAHTHSLVAEAAERRAYVTVTLRVSTDPVVREGRFGGFVLVRGTVTRLQWRGSSLETHAPVLVLGRGSWRHVSLGAAVRLSGVLTPSDGTDLAGTLSVGRAPIVVREPGALLDAAADVRRNIREAASVASPVARELVPGLVVGDDAGLSDEVVEEFQLAGLTHLTAVSGTNLTLVVGFLLILARWAGIRGRALLLVGMLGVAGFVLIARAEPSVVRAAAMGSVALLGMGAAGRERGVRALSVAVLVLLLYDPWLGRSAGFALSVLATAGILFLGPPLRDAIMRWAPRWVAEAVAVPFAAQVACTPVVAAISGTVSLVAVLANVLVAVVVGPATVLGLAGGLTMYVAPWLGHLQGRFAGWCADWIALVAHRASSLPAGSVTWSTGLLGLVVLTACCLLVALGAPRFAAKALRSVLGAVLLVVVMIRPPPTPGWPPEGWVMVACDVGQGDALVLNAGEGQGVVVDAGPEPEVVDRCLRRLRVDRLPVVVLTHFHADHVDGLAGVLKSRRVGELAVTGLRDPAGGAAHVDRVAAGLPVRVPAYGEVREIGALRWQVVGPVPGGSLPLDESEANNASLVLLVEVRGVRILLSGDAEPGAQQRLARSVGPFRVDVLKVPHHGSRYQDDTFLAGLGARLAVVSAGEGNDYGHPSPRTLQLLRGAGTDVRRTDLDGDIAVVVRGGRLRVVTSR